MKTIIILSFILFAILQSYSQDYLISFAGTGASNAFDSVKVNNLTQNKSIIVPAGYDLRLKSVLTGISSLRSGAGIAMMIYPNPALEYSNVEISVKKGGNAYIEISDLSGKHLASIDSWLEKGTHKFTINGVNSGIYVLREFSDDQNLSGIIVSQSAGKGDLQINYNGKLDDAIRTSEITHKNTNSEIEMQYNAGDLLMFTAISGDYSTVFMDVPSESKPITFNFVGSSDGDNINYPSLTIGTQTWMAADLKTTSYNDGTAIPEITGNAEWAELRTPGYCWYNNDSSAYADTYGAMYNWYAVHTSKLCPAGWHVPTDAEWAILANYLGGDSIAGGKLKESGTLHWSQPNTAATNESGFTALPGGTRNSYGTFNNNGLVVGWWSSNEAPPSGAYTRPLFFDTPDAYMGWAFKYEGFHVRCLLGEEIVALPVITTREVSEINDTSAIIGVNVYKDGGSAIMETGVYWGIIPDPKTTGSKRILAEVTGEFSAQLTGLSPATIYFIQAYAINIAGEVVGDEVQFTTTGGNFTRSYFKINDIEYELSDGGNFNYGNFEGAGIYNHDIYLLGPGHNPNWETAETNGAGAVINFSLFNTTEVIESGMYTFSTPEVMNTIEICDSIDVNADGIINDLDCFNTMPAGAYFISSGISVYDTSANLKDDFTGFDFISGNVLINRNGDQFTIEFDCIGVNGDVVTGFYSGILHYFNITLGKKAGKLRK